MTENPNSSRFNVGSGVKNALADPKTDSKYEVIGKSVVKRRVLC